MVRSVLRLWNGRIDQVPRRGNGQPAALGDLYVKFDIPATDSSIGLVLASTLVGGACRLENNSSGGEARGRASDHVITSDRTECKVGFLFVSWIRNTIFRAMGYPDRFGNPSAVQVDTKNSVNLTKS